MPRKDLSKRKAWEEKIQDWQESGLSMHHWCLEKNEKLHALKYWRQTLKRKSIPPKFEELKDKDNPLDIELFFGELRIHFPRGCTANLLEECLKCARKVQCSQ